MNSRTARVIAVSNRKQILSQSLTASSNRQYLGLVVAPSLRDLAALQLQRRGAVSGQSLRRRLSTAPSSGPIPKPESVVGQSGRVYKIEETLQDKGGLLGCVYLASDGNNSVVLKEIPQEWEFRKEIYDAAASCPHIRLPIDMVPEERIFVFAYLNENLLNMAQRELSLGTIKRILRDTLEGLASLHDLGISHNDVKANNILIQTKQVPSGIDIEKVEVTDLEDAVQLSPGQILRGAPLGNFMWRSPEAHAEGPMELASDMFAFGIVCIYAMTKVLIFAVDNPNASEDDRLGTVFFRQISYFADEDGTRGLYEYLGKDNEVREVFEAVEEACKDVPKAPFKDWRIPGLDSDFKDLVIRMTKLDPRKRITAREALAHKWFQ